MLKGKLTERAFMVTIYDPYSNETYFYSSFKYYETTEINYNFIYQCTESSCDISNVQSMYLDPKINMYSTIYLSSHLFFNEFKTMGEDCIL